MRLCLLLLAAALACSAPSPAQQARTLVTLVTRDGRLRIAEGARFSVLDANGVVVARSLTERDLAARYPDLFEVYLQGSANGAVLDARIEPAYAHASRGAER